MTENEILAAVYTALTTNNLNGAPRAVYDQSVVPDEKAGPYITLGYSQAFQGERMNESERKYALDIHIWSQANGRKECQAIAQGIDSLLCDKALTVGASTCWVWFEELQVLLDESGWWHGVLTLRTELTR